MSQILNTRLTFSKTLGVRADSLIIICCLAVVLVCFVLTLLTATRVLPFTDGWYEALIYLKDKGLKPYHDIEFVLPPITPIFYQLLKFFTGGDIAANKIIGVFITLLTSGMVFVWLRPEHKTISALVAATLFFIMLSTFPVYIARDYHTLVDLFAILSLAMMTKAYRHRTITPAALGYYAVVGVGVALLFLTKQNVGLIVMLAFASYIFLAQIIFTKTSAHSTKWLRWAGFTCAYVFGIAAACFLIVSIYSGNVGVGAFIADLLNVQSKGSVLYMATRLIHDTTNGFIFTRALLMAVAFVIAHVLASRFKDKIGMFVNRIPHLWQALVAIAGAYVAIRHYQILWLDPDFVVTLTLAAYFLNIYTFLGAIYKSKKIDLHKLSILLLFTALVFANTLTASVNIIGTSLLFAYYVAYWGRRGIFILRKMDPLWGHLATIACSIIVCTIIIKLESEKFMEPYSWWGIKEPAAASANTQPNIPDLKNMRLNRVRAEMYEKIVQAIQSNTTPSDPIFVYPNMPIFYMLADRLPATRSYVQWFDVTRQQTLVNDFTKLSTDMPKLVLEMKLPTEIYVGHQGLIGDKLVQKLFADHLQCLVNTGAFSEIDSYLYSQDTNVAGTYSFASSVPISAEQILTFASYLRAQRLEIEIDGAMVGGELITLKQLVQSTHVSEKLYSIISIRGNSQQILSALRNWSKTSAYVLSIEASNVLVRTLKRNDNWREKGAACIATLQAELPQYRVDPSATQAHSVK